MIRCLPPHTLKQGHRDRKNTAKAEEVPRGGGGRRDKRLSWSLQGILIPPSLGFSLLNSFPDREIEEEKMSVWKNVSPDSGNPSCLSRFPTISTMELETWDGISTPLGLHGTDPSGGTKW